MKPHWAQDPSGRHVYRWWNGAVWTEHVSDGGAQNIDPLSVQAQPPSASQGRAPDSPIATSIRATRKIGWPVHAFLTVITGGLWLAGLATTTLWRRGSRKGAAAVAVTAVAVVLAGAVANNNAKPSPVAASASPGVSTVSPPSPTLTAAKPFSSPSLPSGASSTTASRQAFAAAPTSAPTSRSATTKATATAKTPTSTPKATTTKPTASKSAPPSTRKFANCAELNAVYPHGVGRPGARDHTTGTPPVTTFLVDAALYAANTGRDRDKDGIACERL